MILNIMFHVFFKFGKKTENKMIKERIDPQGFFFS